MTNYPLTFACKNKNSDIRMSSRSGGVFTELANQIIAKGGKVYGCVKTSDHLAKHIGTDSKNQIEKMRGSKYVPSDLGDTFVQAENDLVSGRIVLYSGLPCQIDGLYAYLNQKKINTDKLYTIDIVCHGVPSPVVWQKYIEYQSKGKIITDIDYRNKLDYGWEEHIYTLFSDNKKISSKAFTRLYYSNEILRESCYHCCFKNTNRVGDISIGDFWGIKQKAPQFDDNKGVSLCLINTDKGKELFDSISNSLDIIPFKLENALQTALVKSNPRPADREYFWHLFYTNQFDKIMRDYGQDTIITRIWLKLPKGIKKFLKRS